jgi:low affinity Fe/Cu permease
MKRQKRNDRPRSKRGGFQKFARTSSRWTGSGAAFGSAVLLILVWGITGPLFHFSDSWQLVINTGTTIITFLMVFLIQNTQNRDNEALQIKLDELLRATSGCHNAVMDIEELSETELVELKREYSKLARKALKDIREGRSDCGVPEVHQRIDESKAAA